MSFGSGFKWGYRGREPIAGGVGCPPDFYLPPPSGCVRALKGPSRVWRSLPALLIGSCARGDYTADSDIDLLIVKKTGKRRLERMREVYALAYSPEHYVALDPLVYTPEELAQRVAMGDHFVIKALSEGKVLYERPQ